MGKLRTDWYCQQWRNDTARRTIARVGGRGKDDVIRGYCVRCPPSCVLCTLHDPDAPSPPTIRLFVHKKLFPRVFVRVRMCVRGSVPVPLRHLGL